MLTIMFRISLYNNVVSWKYVTRLSYRCTNKFAILLKLYKVLHTYTNIWPAQPFNQGYLLTSHTSHVVCVKFISGGTYSLTFVKKKLFHGRFIYSQEFLTEICWEEIAEEIYIFPYFVLRSGLGYEPGLNIY